MELNETGGGAMGVTEMGVCGEGEPGENQKCERER